MNISYLPSLPEALIIDILEMIVGVETRNKLLNQRFGTPPGF